MTCNSTTENFFYGNRFKVIFGDKQFDGLDRKLTDITVPNLAIGFTEQPTPIRKIFIPGDSLDFGDLIATFVLDEDYSNYKMVLNWMMRLRNFDEIDITREVVDISIMLLDAKYKETMSFICKECFPYNISDVVLNQQIDDTEPVNFDVSFKINGVTYE